MKMCTISKNKCNLCQKFSLCHICIIDTTTTTTKLLDPNK